MKLSTKKGFIRSPESHACKGVDVWLSGSGFRSTARNPGSQEANILRRRSFTLVELLVSITIFALASVAVYSVLSNGITAWRRGNKDNTHLRKIRLVTEKMAKDLRNTFKISGIQFEGREDSVSFPVLILAEEDLSLDDDKIHRQVGQVVYFYDKNTKAMKKSEKSFSKAYGQEVKVEDGKVLFEYLDKLEFSYCYLDNATGNYKWKDDWKKEEQDSIPIGVKLKMVFEKKIELEDFERTIFIPIGTGEQMIELGSSVEEVETE